MTAPTLREQAVRLLRDGVPNAAVARRLGVPVGTVSWWKHRDRAQRGELPGRRRSTCPHCHGDALDTAAYGYLLGLYLGDGHISHPAQHRSPSLTISCDDRWPGIMDAAEQAVRAVLPNNAPCRVRRKGCHDVKVYSTHLPCLFPQHGPGRKHERRIALEPWQQEIVGAHPWELIRGLLHSDGCRVVNRATRSVGGAVRCHEYPRYFFSNTSADIRALFTGTLDAVGVRWRASAPGPRGQVGISVARRACVALLDAHVGPKW
ncbi:helix-turn-helix domain-containing protein [Kitasatospora paranensis]|uniref:Helix-turn-helix domain-containing protein n=1 Tax=Kitasatospora paranensis TaxID=258053 RepID=A0ABW2G403_9ACTN